MLPDATQVADPFHVVQLANRALDECRRRAQNDTLGHRGRKTDPLYRARRRLTIAKQRLSADQHDRLLGPQRAGDPRQEVWFAGLRRKLSVRSTTTPTPNSPPKGSTRSAAISPTPRCPSRFASRPNHRPPGCSHRCLAPLTRLERTDRSGEQPRQAHQAGCIRTGELPTPPSPLRALRRQARLDPAPIDPTLKREEPHFVASELDLGRAGHPDVLPVAGARPERSLPAYRTRPSRPWKRRKCAVDR